MFQLIICALANKTRAHPVLNKKCCSLALNIVLCSRDWLKRFPSNGGRGQNSGVAEAATALYIACIALIVVCRVLVYVDLCAARFVHTPFAWQSGMFALPRKPPTSRTHSLTRRCGSVSVGAGSEQPLCRRPSICECEHAMPRVLPPHPSRRAFQATGSHTYVYRLFSRSIIVVVSSK